MTENQFLCGLSLAVGKQAQLSRMEMQKISNFYKTADGRVQYKEFCDMMENGKWVVIRSVSVSLCVNQSWEDTSISNYFGNIIYSWYSRSCSLSFSKADNSTNWSHMFNSAVEKKTENKIQILETRSQECRILVRRCCSSTLPTVLPPTPLLQQPSSTTPLQQPSPTTLPHPQHLKRSTSALIEF